MGCNAGVVRREQRGSESDDREDSTTGHVGRLASEKDRTVPATRVPGGRARGGSAPYQGSLLSIRMAETIHIRCHFLLCSLLGPSENLQLLLFPPS